VFGGGGGEVYDVRASEQDVNRVVLALKTARAAAAAKAPLGGALDR
jgi:hypothetical protein